MAERTSEVTEVPGAKRVTEFTHQASHLLKESSPEELQEKLDRFFPLKPHREKNKHKMTEPMIDYLCLKNISEELRAEIIERLEAMPQPVTEIG